MKMNRFALCGGLGVLALSLSACVSLTPDPIYPIGKYQAADLALLTKPGAPLEASIKTAKSGDVVLSQAVVSAVTYELANDVEPDGNISLAVQARTLELEKGMVFYPAVVLGKTPSLAACSVDRPTTWSPRLNPDAKGQGKVCFVLDEIEREKDAPIVVPALMDASSSTIFFPSEGFGLGMSSEFQQLQRWDPQLSYKVAPAAEFRIRKDAEAGDGPSLALRFMVTPEGNTLEPVYLKTDGLPAKTTGEPVKIAADTVFPTKVEYEGAKIELLAIEDGVLAYRVLTGFTAGGSFVMDLPE